MRPINQAVAEGFFLIGCTQVAAEVKNCIVFVQGQGFQETLQFLKTVADFRRIGFVGFRIGLIELFRTVFLSPVPGSKGWLSV